MAALTDADYEKEKEDYFQWQEVMLEDVDCLHDIRNDHISEFHNR